MSTTRLCTAVLIDGRALLIEGPPGSGKSTLALSLIDRGATLIGDDGATLERRDDCIWASPPPHIAGLIEMRNVGLLTLPTSAGTVALILSLSANAPRHVETAETFDVLGVSVPRLRFDPAIPAAAIRAEYALRQYGLSQ